MRRSQTELVAAQGNGGVVSSQASTVMIVKSRFINSKSQVSDGWCIAVLWMGCWFRQEMEQSWMCMYVYRLCTHACICV